MKLLVPDLIEEFIREHPEQLQGLDPKDVKLACYNVFQSTRASIESGLFQTIRLKYFGTFLVYSKRAVGLLNNIEGQHEAGKLDEKLYTKLKTNLVNLINKRDEEVDD